MESRYERAVWAAATPEDLWQELVVNPFSFSREDPREPADLLVKLHGDGQPGAAFTALLLLTDRSWYRRAAHIVAEVTGCGALNEAELDELAESLVDAAGVVVDFPQSWIDERFSFELVLDDDGEAYDDGPGAEPGPWAGPQGPPVAADAEIAEPCVRSTRAIPPQARRWAAARLARADQARLASLLEQSASLPPDDRAAVLGGIMDAVTALDREGRLDESARADAVVAGVTSSRGTVRLKALELLRSVDAHAARERASRDPDAKVRAWSRQPSTLFDITGGPAPEA